MSSRHRPHRTGIPFSSLSFLSHLICLHCSARVSSRKLSSPQVLPLSVSQLLRWSWVRNHGKPPGSTVSPPVLLQQPRARQDTTCRTRTPSGPRRPRPLECCLVPAAHGTSHWPRSAVQLSAARLAGPAHPYRGGVVRVQADSGAGVRPLLAAFSHSIHPPSLISVEIGKGRMDGGRLDSHACQDGKQARTWSRTLCLASRTASLSRLARFHACCGGTYRAPVLVSVPIPIELG